MSKPYPAVKIVISGQIQGVQSWSCGLWVWHSTLSPSHAQLQTYISDLYGPLNVWLAAAGGPMKLCSADTEANHLAVYYYPPNSDVATEQAEGSLGVFVGLGSNSIPTQSSVVLSLRTGLPGRVNKGRLYWPATGPALTSHQIASALAGTLASTTATAIAGINALTLDGDNATVAVATSLRDFPADVTQVVVDSRVDTQRRRADKTPALYTGTAAV